ncbi:hypothetical protein FRB94_006379 [Tulasnella sp. JGI-2019a]|nr:hypothetical protein FRB94_006379 [Tulasnella sp. JGI-2019a]
MSSSTATSTSLGASDTNSSGSGNDLTTNSFLCGIFIFLILFSATTLGTVWRRVLVRRYRRHNEWRGYISRPINVPVTIPITHNVSLKKTVSPSSLGFGRWMPLSSSISAVKDREVIAGTSRDPNTGVTMIHNPYELTLGSECRRYSTRRRQWCAEKGSSPPATTAKTISHESTPRSYRVATTVLIAMPSQPSIGRSTITTREAETLFPEVALGVYDTVIPVDAQYGFSKTTWTGE